MDEQPGTPLSQIIKSPFRDVFVWWKLQKESVDLSLTSSEMGIWPAVIDSMSFHVV